MPNSVHIAKLGHSKMEDAVIFLHVALMKKIPFKKIMDAEKAGVGHAVKNTVDNIITSKRDKSVQTQKTPITPRAALWNKIFKGKNIVLEDTRVIVKDDGKLIQKISSCFFIPLLCLLSGV